MKRKRGPTSYGESVLQKQQPQENPDRESSEENAVSGGEDSFEGFSSDEEDGEQTRMEADVDNANVVRGSTSATAKKRVKKTAPTQEELMELVFRSSSFQSNLFKLQVDELLSEVRVKYYKMERVEKILHKLKDVLLHLPDSEEQLVNISYVD